MIDLELDYDLAPDVVTPLARIRWGEYRFRIIDADEERFQLVCSDGTGTRRELERQQVPHLVAKKAIVIEHYHFNVDGTVASKQIDRVLASYPIAKQVRALEDYEWCELLRQDYEAKKVKLYYSPLPVLACGALPLNRWILQNMAIVRERMAAIRRIGDPESPQKPRKGQPTLDVHPPGVTQLKDNFRKFRDPGFGIVQFVDGYANCGSGPKLDPETQMVMADVCYELYARNTRFSPSMVLQAIAADLTVKANKVVKGPCLETLARFLSTLDQGRLMLARFGFKKAREVKGNNAKGPKYTRVGEMVLMDCWKIDIVVLLKRCGVWMSLSVKERKLWGVRRRIWVCVALDSATRVVLGMAFGLSESPELSRRVLRMIGSDKSAEAEATGCMAPPPSPVGIEGLRTDSGIAFRHGYFVAAALTLVDHLKVGIVGKPWRNGLMERFFRTPKEQLLPYFSGLTFGNPQARGDFDAMADASATLDVFGDAMFRFFNDVYRLREHRGLDRQPPFNRMQEAMETTGIKEPPSDDLQLVAFGLENERPIPLTSQGLTVNGIEYKAVWLGNIFSSKVHTAMRVKVDPCNLGHVAVMWEGAWQIVDGPPEFDGVGLSVWRRTKEQLHRRYGEQAAVNFPIVAKTLLDLREMGARERLKAKILDMTYDNAKLKQEANGLRLRVIYRPAPAQHSAPRALSQGAFGQGFTTGENGKADLSGDGGDLFDPDTNLPEFEVCDALAEPAVERGDFSNDAEPEDEISDDPDSDDTKAKTAVSPPNPPRRKTHFGVGLTITTVGDLLKSRKRN